MRNRYLPLIVVALVTVALGLWVRDFVAQVILEPILYLTWFTSLVIRSLPQLLFWGLFVALALFVAIGSLRSRPRGARRGRAVEAANYGAVGTRARLFQLARSHSYSKWKLARDLGRLAWEIAQPGQDPTFERQSSWFGDATSGISRDIADYFLAGLQPFRPVHLPWYRFRSRTPPSPLDLDPDIVVGYLEQLHERQAGA